MFYRMTIPEPMPQGRLEERATAHRNRLHFHVDTVTQTKQTQRDRFFLACFPAYHSAFHNRPMKTIYYTASSLDGFIATQDDSLQWLFALGNPTDSSYPEFISQVGALAMGASTYLWLVQNSEQVKAETGSAWPYSQPAWIFTSRDLPRIENADLRFAQGDVIPVHHEMKVAAEGKNIWIVGGGDLAGQFYDSGLLDEVIIQIGSVSLGSGKPVLPRQILPPQLQLQSAQQRGSGFVELRYLISKSASSIPSS